MTHTFRTVFAAAAAAFMLVAVAAAPSSADPLVSRSDASGRSENIVVHSAAMNRDIPLTVFRPRDESRPAGVLYLLNGAGGGEDEATWQNKTDIASFLADKNAYVIIPMAGAFSYYTDWENKDDTLGVNKWSTFLGKELPPVIDGAFNTNGKNAIAGISSSATSVLNLAIEHQGLYRAVAGYSGCASTSTPTGQTYIRLVVETRGDADARNMWGPYTGTGWRTHDPVLHASKLRGVSLYLSAATGLPGRYDTTRYVPDAGVLADQIGLGGGIEAATRICTEQLASKLASLRIPATVDRPATGTHSWMYWQDQLHKSWPQIARSIR